MNVKKFVKPKENEDRYHQYLFLLQNFDESCLEVHYSRAGEHEDSNKYSIKYQKFGEKEIFPIYFVIPEFYRCINSDKEDVFGKKYSSVCCGYVFNDLKELVEIIIEKISKIRGKKYEIKSDYTKIRVGAPGIEKMPVGNLMKISWAVVSFKLICENKNGLIAFNDLKECFYEASINDDFEIIESEK